MMRRFSRLWAAVVAGTLAASIWGVGGCAVLFPAGGLGGSVSAPAEFGATQGGVQDMGLARELIASGRVPPPEAFVVEGMFSEHDLGLTGDACTNALCLRTALGVAPTLDGAPSAWLEVGMSSMIDMDTFARPTLTVIACIDVSGSMGWEYAGEQTEYPSAGQVSRNLLSALAGELTAADQIAIVTYGTTVDTVLGLTGGDDQGPIQAAIDSLSTGGVTDMESGLVRAFELARNAGTQTEQTRVMLFTDIQPNVGATTPSEFEQIVGEGAADGIGITVFGVGVGMGQELLLAIADLRGGNAFSLFDNEDVTELMADDWPWLVSPIAYDLDLALTPSERFTAAETYGFPGGDEESGPQLAVKTIFLSKRRGALLVRFEPAANADQAADADQAAVDWTTFSVAGRLAYNTPEGVPITQDVQTAYTGQLDQRGQYFEQPSVGSTVALALLVSGMADAAEQYATDPEQAVATMGAVRERFAADAAALGDEQLAPEVELAQQLLELMEAGAQQGDLYGQY